MCLDEDKLWTVLPWVIPKMACSTQLQKDFADLATHDGSGIFRAVQGKS
jgi:hypothetical protein